MKKVKRFYKVAEFESDRSEMALCFIKCYSINKRNSGYQAVEKRRRNQCGL